MALVGEGIGFRHILVVGAVGRLALFGKYDRHVVEVAEQRGDGNSAGLDGKYLVYRLSTEAAF